MLRDKTDNPRIERDHREYAILDKNGNYAKHAGLSMRDAEEALIRWDEQEADRKVISDFKLLFKFDLEYVTDPHMEAMIEALAMVERWDIMGSLNKDRAWYRWHPCGSAIKPDKDGVPILLRGTIVSINGNMIGYEVGEHVGGKFCVNNDLIDFIPTDWSEIR